MQLLTPDKTKLLRASLEIIFYLNLEFYLFYDLKKFSIS